MQMTKTLQDKIDAIFKSHCDAHFEDYSEQLDQWREINKAIQELKEEIINLNSCGRCKYCGADNISRRDVLSLIGEKK